MKTYVDHLLENAALRPAYVEGSLGADAHLLLAQAFEASGLTQTEFGTRMGVTRARASQIINGDGNLTLSLMARAAAALDMAWRVQLEDLFSGELRHSLATQDSWRAEPSQDCWRVLPGSRSENLQQVHQWLPEAVGA